MDRRVAQSVVDLELERAVGVRSPRKPPMRLSFIAMVLWKRALARKILVRVSARSWVFLLRSGWVCRSALLMCALDHPICQKVRALVVQLQLTTPLLQ